jgi:DNA excision repair protein ERCC-2
MSLSRDCICPVVVSKNNDQQPLNSAFETRNNEDTMLSYGRLLLAMAEIVPDGLLGLHRLARCPPTHLPTALRFCPSYKYMEDLVSKWDDKGMSCSCLSPTSPYT